MSTNQYGKSDACGAQEQKSRGGPGSVVPESTQAGFCVFFGSGPGVKNLWKTGPGVTFEFWPQHKSVWAFLK